ncbi:hypothetical protein B0T21DRAFT_410829 [Apiosordaria backusii]|uniref:DUF6594 domain-containing protein n=1 Tax=Apiosordaria backusii TaxID=314023 RepID=A0AA40EGY2_9PEZI|nr:hypothetical protein B0T21DRAFT_410829 [Apiosordaria backusii]
MSNSESAQTPRQLETGNHVNTPALRRPEGYDRLARMMGSLPEMAMFRRFGVLSAEDLLYRQAELQELEAALRRFQKEDKQSGHQDREDYALDWDALQRSGADDAAEGNDSAQWDTILEIREKLKDYQEALLRHRRVLALGPAIPRQVKALNSWMERPDRGNVFLLGADRNIWKDPTTLEDLVSLEVPSEEQSFTNPFTVGLVDYYNQLIGRHVHKPDTREFLPNTIRYTNEGIFRVLKIICTITASLLPILGIHVLYHIETMEGRMAAISALTALFSFALSLFTSARVKDIFAATAA